MAESLIPETLLYSAEDEWLRVEEQRVTVGITDFAQQQLGEGTIMVKVMVPSAIRLVKAVPKGTKIIAHAKRADGATDPSDMKHMTSGDIEKEGSAKKKRGPSDELSPRVPSGEPIAKKPSLESP